MTSRGVFSVLVLTFATGSCSAPESATSPSSVAPSSPVASSAPRVGPAPLAYVMDTALRRVAGARVEILDGPQAGTVLTTDAQGQFELTGPFLSDNTFRASADG